MSEVEEVRIRLCQAIIIVYACDLTCSSINSVQHYNIVIVIVRMLNAPLFPKSNFNTISMSISVFIFMLVFIFIFVSLLTLALTLTFACLLFLLLLFFVSRLLWNELNESSQGREGNQSRKGMEWNE